MNKLFILGNGFDLAHKLPTSYEHFIIDYLKQALQLLRHLLKRVKRTKTNDIAHASK